MLSKYFSDFFGRANISIQWQEKHDVQQPEHQCAQRLVDVLVEPQKEGAKFNGVIQAQAK